MSDVDWRPLAALQDGSLVGFAAIEAAAQLKPVQPLTTASRIGGSRRQESRDGFTSFTWPSQYAPRGDLRGHFEFGLKYDELNLEWLARLFEATGPQWIDEWVAATPTSIYARRAACLYEWMTGARLNSADTPATNYELLVDPGSYLTATTPERSRRWKIDNNLPGTPSYCPLVRWTPSLHEAAQFDTQAELDKLTDRFGEDLLLRSAAWLTFAESRATFAIEREADRANDIKRFAAAMAQHCGKIDDPLSDASLRTLQREVLGERALRTGVRQSPVFIGSAAHHEATIVHYIAPPHAQLPGLMDGLRHVADCTIGSSPLVRAAVLSFGFVYIHPLSDGNGRVHRLLINDTLMRDGAVPAGVILPVSASILERKNFGDYQRALDSLSARQVQRYNGRWHFHAEQIESADGVFSDFAFDADEECRPFWAYPDLTRHAQYTCTIVAQTISQNMTDEAAFLARHDEAKRRIKSVFEMPDRDAERIIRSLRETPGRVSNKLGDQYPSIFQEDMALASQVMEAVQSAFEDRAMESFLQEPAPQNIGRPPVG